MNKKKKSPPKKPPPSKLHPPKPATASVTKPSSAKPPASPAASSSLERLPPPASPPPTDASAPMKGSPPPTGTAAQIDGKSPSDLSASEIGSQTQILETASSTQAISGATSKPSWVDMIKGPGAKMEKKGTPFVLESGELCVQIPNEVILRNKHRWEPFILGQFHGNLPSPGALHAILNGIWSNRLRDITISRLSERSILIRIPSAATRQRVLSQGAWQIEGQTMFVADWEPGLNPTLPEITEVPVWLEFRGVPPHYFSEEGFEHVAGMLGHPMYCHPSTINMTNTDVGKVLTIINPTKPLPEAVNVQFPTGEIFRVTVSCPWLPPICSHCQEVGHSIRRCPTAPITCQTCNSSSHSLDKCPRAKKKETQKVLEAASPASSKPKKKKEKRASSVATQWVKKNNLPASLGKNGEDLKLQVELGSQSKAPSDPIAKKLDRILVNDNWQLEFPLSFASFGDPDFSDHCPGCLTIGNYAPSKKPFMVSHFLMQHPDFLPRVSEFWRETVVSGTAMFRFSKKLKLLKNVIKDINRQHYSGIETRVKEAHSALVLAQSRLLASPSPSLAAQEKRANMKWLTLAAAEEKFLYQRSRVKWVESGDCNSAYFHRMVSTRRAINQIHYLEDSQGQKLEVASEVQSHCVDYYLNLLGTASATLSDSERDLIGTYTPYRCTATIREALQADITDADIKREAFSLPLNKSPGPDGYTSEFIRAAWEIIGDDLTAAVKEFFVSGQILRQWNATAITLIPKKEGADKIGDFRPISCCNAVYKIVSKILARRLQAILPTMISNSQSAFVQGRLLVENVLLATEMVQGFNRKSISARGLLKVDLRKAFDSVNWDFILHILEVADFPPVFINWIRLCLTTPSFSIKVNGELCGYFPGKRGLRQGDPLSPPLFVMAMEVFSNLLLSKYDQGSIGYHPLGCDPKISHLAFADDILLFFDGKATSLQAISTTMDCFQALSGLKMNKDKTELFYAGISQPDEQSLVSFGFQPGTLPIRYLGLPLLHRKLRKSDYSPLLDKVASRFNSWAVKCLSFAGRLQLISSVIYGLINFWMTAFALPKGCLKSLEKLCNNFLWAGGTAKRTNAKVSWEKICLPKSEGGLGLRNLLVWNKVLNLKLIWLLFSNGGSLWVAWMKSHYFKSLSYWSADASSYSSWIWKFLLSLRPLAKALLRCTIGDGLTASFWHDSWSPLGVLTDLIGNNGPLLLGIHINATVAEACHNQGWRLPSSRSRNQNIISLRNYLLSAAPPSASRGPDTYSLTVGNRSLNRFSTKLTWEHIRPSENRKSWDKAVWFKASVPKHAFTFWVANLNRLPVRTRMLSWGMQIPLHCTLCNSEAETRDHLFLHCPYSEEIWHTLLKKLGQHPCVFVDWSSLITWLLSRSVSLSPTLKRIAVHALVFHIWKERNTRIHDNLASPPASLYSKLDRSIRDILLARRYRKGCGRLLTQWFSHI